MENNLKYMRERRVFIRVPIGVEATYQVIQKLAPPRLGLSADLSLGGMRLAQPERLEPGQEVSVTLSLPTQGQTVFRGVVVWCRESLNGRGGHESGLRWIEVNPAAQARLNAFLTERTHSAASAPLPDLTISSPIVWSRVALVGLIACSLLFAIGLFLSIIQR